MPFKFPDWFSDRSFRETMSPKEEDRDDEDGEDGEEANDEEESDKDENDDVAIRPLR